MSDSTLPQREVTLLEVLERVLNKGVVIVGDLTISVAGVDLIYLGLRLLLSSVETMEQARFAPLPDHAAAHLPLA